MSLLVIGLSHRSAPVSVLERASLSADAQGKLLQDTLAAEPAAEAAVLATCNRIELYADVEKFHAGVAELSTLLAQHSGVGLEELTPYLYVHYEDRAVHHLFSVACGLDSMVVGEGQILGQIKDALARGQEQHSAGRLINDLFQQSLRVGKRAHSETGIDRAGQSLVTFGLEQLAEGAEVESWAVGKRVLVIGAGSMSSLAATTLARLGVAELVIANRTLDRAERLASVLSGAALDDMTVRAVPMVEVAGELTRADAVVSCTGATGLVLTAEAVAGALSERAVSRQDTALSDSPSPDEDHPHPGDLLAPEGSLVARLAATAARDGRVPDQATGSMAAVDDVERPGGVAGEAAGSGSPTTAGPASLRAATTHDGADDAGTCPIGLDVQHSPRELSQHGVWAANAENTSPAGSAAHPHRVRSAVPNGRGSAPVSMGLLDLAMPRDIDHAVHRLPGVRLVDIESLAEASADAPMAADVDQVRRIVSDEVAAFGAAQRAAHITPTVVALRTMAADVVAGEIARLEGRLPALDEKERAEIKQTVRRVVDKLLHAPTVRVKQLASEPGGAGYADALRTLFDLDPETVASVSRADLNDADVKNRGRV
ncbi:glutamyl-tRNA reductase [Streptomyces albipurpureus]|uniref:Glutamyl-tRNA reductase n=1 Tax=Streptomyces albipurpureus TaxID=2897419 RepID=A0ABT0V111_9ACTN|nr:glutamyl-tRNA reductase [Streptomyces sp. CWNU-1]MCM2394025.1 glutamyl-tRNA reductase [Streptomyces sp. CWNU-1]